VSVLTAAQSAGVKLLGVKPGSLFSTTNKFAMELADLANDVATDIAKAHDWQQLRKLATLSGDGVKIAFDLPADYDRMLKATDVHSKNWKSAKFIAVRDEDQWLYIQQTAATGAPGYWIMLGGKFQIYPPMPVGEEAQFYYVRNTIVNGANATFSSDGETFALSERLLMLGLVWRWRAQKKMDYAEDMTNYELALEKLIASDKGSQKLVAGRQRVPTNAAIAFPGALGQS
jgi:hypothetical protein